LVGELSLVITSWLDVHHERTEIELDDLADERDDPAETGIHPAHVLPEPDVQPLLIGLDDDNASRKYGDDDQDKENDD